MNDKYRRFRPYGTFSPMASHFTYFVLGTTSMLTECFLHTNILFHKSDVILPNSENDRLFIHYICVFWIVPGNSSVSHAAPKSGTTKYRWRMWYEEQGGVKTYSELSGSIPISVDLNNYSDRRQIRTQTLNNDRDSSKVSTRAANGIYLCLVLCTRVAFDNPFVILESFFPFSFCVFNLIDISIYAGF